MKGQSSEFTLCSFSSSFSVALMQLSRNIGIRRALPPVSRNTTMLLYISTNLEKTSPSSSDHQLSTDLKIIWFKIPVLKSFTLQIQLLFFFFLTQGWSDHFSLTQTDISKTSNVSQYIFAVFSSHCSRELLTTSCNHENDGCFAKVFTWFGSRCFSFPLKSTYLKVRAILHTGIKMVRIKIFSYIVSQLKLF